MLLDVMLHDILGGHQEILFKERKIGHPIFASGYAWFMSCVQRDCTLALLVGCSLHEN